MKRIYLNLPPFPFFVCAGTALYRPGDKHSKRSNIGVFDIVFVEHGNLSITENGTPYDLEAGDVLILSSNGTHFGHKICREQTLFHWIHFAFDGEFTITSKSTNIRNEIRTQTNSSLYRPTREYTILPVAKRLTEDEQQLFLNYFKNINSVVLDSYSRNRRITQQTTGLYSQEQFLRILQLLQIQPSYQKTSNSLADDIMQYLTNYYYNPITLEMLSEQFSFHPAHLIRCMKKAYNVTPIEALNQIRIDKAKQLLMHTPMSNLEIASSVGFTSATYFNRIFKKQTGMTPKEYQAKQNDPPTVTEESHME